MMRRGAQTRVPWQRPKRAIGSNHAELSLRRFVACKKQSAERSKGPGIKRHCRHLFDYIFFTLNFFYIVCPCCNSQRKRDVLDSSQSSHERLTLFYRCNLRLEHRVTLAQEWHRHGLWYSKGYTHWGTTCNEMVIGNGRWSTRCPTKIQQMPLKYELRELAKASELSLVHIDWALHIIRAIITRGEWKQNDCPAEDFVGYDKGGNASIPLKLT